VPKHGLVAGDAGFAGRGLDFVDDVNGAQRTAAHEDRVGVGTIEADGEVSDERRVDSHHVGVVGDVQPLDIEHVVAALAHVARFDLIHLVEVRRRYDDLLRIERVERSKDTRHERRRYRVGRSGFQFGAHLVFTHDDAARRAGIADDVEPGIGGQQAGGVGESVDHRGEVGRGDLIRHCRASEVHPNARWRVTEHVIIDRLLHRQQDKPDLRPIVPTSIENNPLTHSDTPGLRGNASRRSLEQCKSPHAQRYPGPAWKRIIWSRGRGWIGSGVRSRRR